MEIFFVTITSPEQCNDEFNTGEEIKEVNDYEEDLM